MYVYIDHHAINSRLSEGHILCIFRRTHMYLRTSAREKEGKTFPTVCAVKTCREKWYSRKEGEEKL